ncbi:CPBP family intramembrane glutamic endopeptidase [Anaerotignum sp.]|uniref:CPBP family intramembrane glutamic endopeptidase n=1 Tax=Anaerotignum sp. TaxID=2039241 RepID=UPI0033325959
MEKEKKFGSFCFILGIYVFCFIFRGFEYLVLRTDQSILGEAFIHKLIGILILLIALRYQSISWREIGFAPTLIGKNIVLGLGLGLLVFIPAYGIEFVAQYVSGNTPSLELYVTSYEIGGNIGNQIALKFYLVCFAGNIMNVVMEEGVFRGLFLKMAEEKNSFLRATVISSVLFGFWHIAAPMRSFLDGQMGLLPTCIAMLSLVLMSGLMGAKLCLLTKICGNLWVPMADHFFNNTIINILHITGVSGGDQLQVLRIAMAQTLSFIIVLILFQRTKANKKVTFRTKES